MRAVSCAIGSLEDVERVEGEGRELVQMKMENVKLHE